MADEYNNVIESLNTNDEDAFRSLMVNIRFSEYGRNIKTLTITSCRSEEGKTTTAMHLAAVTAKHGLKVLLVDTDMRKPMFMKKLGCRSSKGLSSYLSGNEQLETITEDTNIAGFNFIPCGPIPTKPLKLFSSSKFSEFINDAAAIYDLVIFDTPPLGSVIDCAVISAQTDGTIIVVQSKSYEPARVIRVKEQLEKVNANILGVILTKVQKDDYVKNCSSYGYYGYMEKFNWNWFKKLRKVSR